MKKFLKNIVKLKKISTIKDFRQFPVRVTLFTDHLFRQRRSSKWGNFQKYWSQNVGQDFIVLYFFHVRKMFVGGRSFGRLMSPVQETQSMREIRLLRGRLPRKGGGLTVMHNMHSDQSRTCWWTWLVSAINIHVTLTCMHILSF